MDSQVADPVGELRSIGVWRAADEDELLEKVLGTLPLRPWMTAVITALESHPNDPDRTDAASATRAAHLQPAR